MQNLVLFIITDHQVRSRAFIYTAHQKSSLGDLLLIMHQRFKKTL